jgi:hypothetical protein
MGPGYSLFRYSLFAPDISGRSTGSRRPFFLYKINHFGLFWSAVVGLLRGTAVVILRREFSAESLSVRSGP